MRYWIVRIGGIERKPFNVPSSGVFATLGTIKLPSLLIFGVSYEDVLLTVGRKFGLAFLSRDECVCVSTERLHVRNVRLDAC